jgi:hypothetical protein
MSDAEHDADGIKLLHKITGNKVDLEDEDPQDIHKNGKRYHMNHKFLNYMMIGYFKTGKGQEVIEQKTDGPNHGGCNEEGFKKPGIPKSKLPNCCWTEINISLVDRKNEQSGNVRKYKAGEFYIACEHPHNINFNAPENIPSAKIIEDDLKEKWIGYATCAWQEGEFRHLQGWIDPDPFDSNGKPKNNWILGIDEVDKGQLTTPELAKRRIETDFDTKGKVPPRGLECEIRMHGATKGDTGIKFAKIYEIIPPT